jgi:hypothetical protein
VVINLFFEEALRNLGASKVLASIPWRSNQVPVPFTTLAMQVKAGSDSQVLVAIRRAGSADFFDDYGISLVDTFFM